MTFYVILLVILTSAVIEKAETAIMSVFLQFLEFPCLSPVPECGKQRGTVQ
jgi:hypothetical protein